MSDNIKTTEHLDKIQSSSSPFDPVKDGYEKVIDICSEMRQFYPGFDHFSDLIICWAEADEWKPTIPRIMSLLEFRQNIRRLVMEIFAPLKGQSVYVRYPQLDRSALLIFTDKINKLLIKGDPLISDKPIFSDQDVPQMSPLDTAYCNLCRCTSSIEQKKEHVPSAYYKLEGRLSVPNETEEDFKNYLNSDEFINAYNQMSPSEQDAFEEFALQNIPTWLSTPISLSGIQHEAEDFGEDMRDNPGFDQFVLILNQFIKDNHITTASELIDKISCIFDVPAGSHETIYFKCPELKDDTLEKFLKTIIPIYVLKAPTMNRLDAAYCNLCRYCTDCEEKRIQIPEAYYTLRDRLKQTASAGSFSEAEVDFNNYLNGEFRNDIFNKMNLDQQKEFDEFASHNIPDWEFPAPHEPDLAKIFWLLRNYIDAHPDAFDPIVMGSFIIILYLSKNPSSTQDQFSKYLNDPTDPNGFRRQYYNSMTPDNQMKFNEFTKQYIPQWN